MSYSILIRKADTRIEVDFDALSDDVKRYVVEYGLKQTLNDAGSSAKGAKALEAAQARLAKLVKGEVPKGGAGPKVDPVRVEFLSRVKKVLGDGWSAIFPEGVDAVSPAKAARLELDDAAIGMALAVRAVGRKANRAKAEKVFATLWAKAEAHVAEQGAADIDELVAAIDA